MKGFPITRRIAVAGLTAIGLFIPALGPGQAGTTHAGAGVLIYPELNSSLWIRNLDPALVTDANSSYMINLLYSGLVKLDGKNNVVPDLAAAMPTISPDRLTYTFKLKPNLKFSDGTPVTAADVVSSITRALSKAEASPNAMLYLGFYPANNDWTKASVS